MSTTPLQSDRPRRGNSRSKLKMIRTGPRAADTMTVENNVWPFRSSSVRSSTYTDTADGSSANAPEIKRYVAL